MRVDRVPTATSLMSRRRCSTPISSASSASIMEGVWTKVLAVVVPSYCDRISAGNVMNIMEGKQRALTSLISSTAK